MGAKQIGSHQFPTFYMRFRPLAPLSRKLLDQEFNFMYFEGARYRERTLELSRLGILQDTVCL